MPGKPRGMPKTGGRVKGVPNKNTTELKDMILNALHGAGGEAYLRSQATENPGAFLSLVGKVLPKDVNANVVGQMILKVITGVPDANPND